MQVTTKRISPVMLEMSVQVPADAVKSEIDKAYNTLAKRAHIRGFRPGKAPRDVLHARLRIAGPRRRDERARATSTLPKVLTENNVDSDHAAERGAGQGRREGSLLVHGALRGHAGRRGGEVRRLRAHAPEGRSHRRDGRTSSSRPSASALDAQDAGAGARREEGRRRHDRLHDLGRRQGNEGRRRAGRADRARRRQALPEIDAGLDGKNDRRQGRRRGEVRREPPAQGLPRQEGHVRRHA